MAALVLVPDKSNIDLSYLGLDKHVVSGEKILSNLKAPAPALEKVEAAAVK